MAFIYWAESLIWESIQHHVVRWTAHMRGGTGILIFNSTTASPPPPEKAGPGPGNQLNKWEALWKELAMERHHHLAAQVLFITGRRWQLSGMLPILQVCACALGCLYNWSKMLNLSLSVSDLTPTAVCWQMLTPNAWMGSLWSGHLLWSAPPLSCFRTDEIWNSLSGAISIRWDDESHQAQLGNLHFRIHIRIINQQLFRLSQRQFVRAPSHKNIHISHCLQGCPKKYTKRRKPFTMGSLWLMCY